MLSFSLFSPVRSASSRLYGRVCLTSCACVTNKRFLPVLTFFSHILLSYSLRLRSLSVCVRSQHFLASVRQVLLRAAQPRGEGVRAPLQPQAAKPERSTTARGARARPLSSRVCMCASGCQQRTLRVPCSYLSRFFLCLSVFVSLSLSLSVARSLCVSLLCALSLAHCHSLLLAVKPARSRSVACVSLARDLTPPSLRRSNDRAPAPTTSSGAVWSESGGAPSISAQRPSPPRPCRPSGFTDHRARVRVSGPLA